MFGSDQPLISNQLPISFDIPTDEKEWKETMVQMVKRINSVVNTKEGAFFLPLEIANFEQWFTVGNTQKFRSGYRKTFDMVTLNGGPIAPGAVATFPHGISNISTATMIWGTATTDEATPKFIPLPYISQTEAEEIQIYITATDVVLANGTLTLSQAYITAEILKV